MERNYERYLKIVEWARRRYQVRGILLIATGENWSRYSMIERMAWDRYIA